MIRFWKKKDLEESAQIEEHAVIAHYNLSGDDFGSRTERDEYFNLEERLVKAIGAAGVGEFDGNEVGGGEVVLYAYGPDADQLYEVMEPALRAHPARPAHVILRYGSPDDSAAREVRINL